MSIPWYDDYVDFNNEADGWLIEQMWDEDEYPHLGDPDEYERRI